MNDARIDLFPFTAEVVAARFGMPVKPTVILIRWPVVIVCCYLVLYPATPRIPEAALYGFIVAYIASNVALYFVSERRFEQAAFYSPLVIADTALLTLSLVINGNVEAEFYLTYFLLIIICCIFEDPKILAAISVLAPAVYMFLLFRSPRDFQPDVFLRLPFLFIVALFYGYFTQLVRAQRALKEEAEKRDQGKKEALDIVSHEFRTPLNLISGYAQALKRGTLGPVNSEQAEALAKILRQSDNLLYMVNSILELARLEAGELSVQPEEIPLAEYLNEMKVAYEVPLSKPILLTWSIPPDLPTIRSDRAKLTVILQNLINNAIKFTDAGNVWVFARHDRDRGQVEIEVRDTGIGIPREAHRWIFDKFRQLDPSSTRTRSGVGLGLHIVKVFTDLLGGTIRLESHPQRGSAFTIALPLSAPPSA
ncbi:MAG TPA: HAMP domain-containing sensor histidine kinase [candidate division Zixibacteria bacterium]|nr:HAMP domain-containing sensor histidine kinase [candidate division Zixibacteria bacterium]